MKILESISFIWILKSFDLRKLKGVPQCKKTFWKKPMMKMMIWAARKMREKSWRNSLLLSFCCWAWAQEKEATIQLNIPHSEAEAVLLCKRGYVMARGHARELDRTQTRLQLKKWERWLGAIWGELMHQSIGVRHYLTSKWVLKIS